MFHTPLQIAIDDLPCLQDEAALFDAAIDPATMQIIIDPIVISIVTNK